MKQRIEPPVFTWFLVGALLFSALTFLLGIWVCSNAPRAGYNAGDEVPTVVEQKNHSIVITPPEKETLPPRNAPAPFPVESPSLNKVEQKPAPVVNKKSKKAAPSQVTKKKNLRKTRKKTIKTKTVKKTGRITSTRQTGKIYYVQLTATVNRKLAEKMKQSYAARGYNMYLVTERKHGKILYKVRIGVFKEWKKAKAIAEKIRREDKLKPWIIAM
ncbi:MAG: SPOR domain-containing protein [Acidobacteria bacterium]|nr:SPOR domain-containing protein [Acidobacteriota bacterium]